MLSIAGPYVGNSAGWVFTEMGRQPWTVVGLFKTADSVSPNVSAGEVLTSLIVFTLLYGVLAVVETRLFLKFTKVGPVSEQEALDSVTHRPPDDPCRSRRPRSGRRQPSRQQPPRQQPSRHRRSRGFRAGADLRVLTPPQSLPHSSRFVWKWNTMWLNQLWFVLIAVLWIGYFVLEGFDFGVGALLRIVGRDERGSPGADQHHRAGLGR